MTGPALRLAALCAVVPAAYLAAAGSDDGPAGGDATVRNATSHAYSQPAPTLDAAQAVRFAEGDRLFEASYVTAPAPVFGGLGPLYNANGCAACHARDGRTPGSLLLRASAPGAGPNGEPLPDPHVGLQVQDRAVFGHAPEARVGIEWTERTERLADGTAVTLREPTYRLDATAQPLSPDLLLSPRAPRPVFGLGLLEAVPDSALHALAARQAAGGEVSGRVNAVWDAAEGRRRAGRFGHKATHATVLSQTAAALADDVGVPSEFVVLGGGEPEVEREVVETLAFYVRALAVPARRRTDDPQVRAGRVLFASVGCAACHAPRLQTGPADVAALAHQTIHPYTDLLLHDMGPGLADGRPDHGASGTEWRTPPLWGIGLTAVVNGDPGFLHDGRARTLTEAVLWHGGEAEPTRERFRALSTAEREALLAFLRSL